MTKRVRENIIKETVSTGDLFKREISRTRQFIKAIIIGNRERAKAKNIGHYHPQFKKN